MDPDANLISSASESTSEPSGSNANPEPNPSAGIGGSGGYISLVKASDDEKKLFKRVVEIVDILLDIAQHKIDPETVVIHDMIEEIKLDKKWEEETKVGEDVVMKNGATEGDDEIMEIDGAEWKGEETEKEKEMEKDESESIADRVAKRAASASSNHDAEGSGSGRRGGRKPRTTRKSNATEGKSTRTKAKTTRKKKRGDKE